MHIPTHPYLDSSPTPSFTFNTEPLLCNEDSMQKMGCKALRGHIFLKTKFFMPFHIDLLQLLAVQIKLRLPL